MESKKDFYFLILVFVPPPLSPCFVRVRVYVAAFIKLSLSLSFISIVFAFLRLALEYIIIIALHWIFIIGCVCAFLNSRALSYHLHIRECVVCVVVLLLHTPALFVFVFGVLLSSTRVCV